jgi:hypothetical protein
MPRAPPSWQPPRLPRTSSCEVGTCTVPSIKRALEPGVENLVPGLFSFADLL